MQVEEYLDFQNPNDIRIKGTRVGIENILYEYIYNNRTPEEIVNCFFSITLEQVYATILYYLQNKERINEYIAQWLEFGHQQRKKQESNPPSVILKLRQLKKQQEQNHKNYESQLSV